MGRKPLLAGIHWRDVPAIRAADRFVESARCRKRLGKALVEERFAATIDAAKLQA